MVELSIGEFIAFGFVSFATRVLIALSTIANIELKRISKNLKEITDKAKEDK